MRFVGAVSWLLATVVLLLVAAPAAGQLGDNVLVQGSPYGAVSTFDIDDSNRLHVASGYLSILIIDPETGNYMLNEAGTAIATVDGNSGVALTSAAFSSAIPFFKYILAVAVILFAFSTMISWSPEAMSGRRGSITVRSV